jgi:hypothetical protein
MAKWRLVSFMRDKDGIIIEIRALARKSCITARAS